MSPAQWSALDGPAIRPDTDLGAFTFKALPNNEQLLMPCTCIRFKELSTFTATIWLAAVANRIASLVTLTIAKHT